METEECEGSNDNAIITINNADHHAYLWFVNIPTYAYENGELVICSSKFSTADHTWQLIFYTNSATDKDCVSVFLGSMDEEEGEPKVVKAFYRISIFDIHKKKVVGTSGMGREDFQPFVPVRVNTFERDEFGGCITEDINIICEIWPEDEETEHSCDDEEEEDEDGNNNECGDVKILIGDRELMVYSNVLAKRSAVLAFMLEYLTIGRDEGDPLELNIVGTEYEVMNELVRFTYEEEINDFGKMAKELMVAAFEFGVWDLIDVCENVLIDQLSLDNVAEYLKLAERCNAPLLKAKASEKCFESLESMEI